MEKIVKVGEYGFPARSTAASLFLYKSHFGRDGIKDLMSLAKAAPNGADVSEDFDIDVFYRFLWTFAKAATPGTPPMTDWLDEFDMSPLDFIAEALPQVQEMLMSTVKSSVKSKK